MFFDVHIAKFSKKIMGMLLFINIISMNFDQSTRKIVIQSLVLSLINYCIGIWGSTNKTQLFSVQKLLKFAF